MAELEDTAEPAAAKPEKEEAPALADVHFDKAKTGRAKCGGCQATLALGDERIAKEINSQHGRIVKSFHPQCGITFSYNEDNRSKCATCGEKLTLGDIRVKVGCSSKSGPGTKHHYDCLFSTAKATNNQGKLQQILADKKALLKEEDRPVAAAGPKAKKAKKEKAAEEV